jgi:sulfur carrier protein
VISVNGREEKFLSETVEALLQRLGVEPRGIAVAIDGEIVHRDEWSSTVVVDECRIEIVTAAAGG